jgi:hypothetical protein
MYVNKKATTDVGKPLRPVREDAPYTGKECRKERSMKTLKTRTFYVERPGPLDDIQRGNVAAGLQQAATTSGLIKSNTVLQGQITQLATVASTLKPGADTVAKDEAQLATDKGIYHGNQGEFDRLYNLILNTIEHDAKSEADIEGANQKPRPKKTVSKGVPETPAPAVPRLPKRSHGFAWATVPETGKTRGRFVAEMSLDPYGPNTWSPLIGNGKERKIVAASGTKVWVRFARVRFGLQSEWSTPVLIVIP